MLLSCSWVYVLSAGVGKKTFMFCFGRHFLQAWDSLLEGSNITAGSWICDFCMSVYWVWLSLWISLAAAQCAKSNISRCVHGDVSRWHKHWKQINTWWSQLHSPTHNQTRISSLLFLKSSFLRERSRTSQRSMTAGVDPHTLPSLLLLLGFANIC